MNTLQLSQTQLTAEGIDNLTSRWIRFIEASPKTIETYNKAVRQFIYYVQAQGITQPTADTIKAFREELKQNHKPTTVQNYIMALKQFFKWTEAEGLYKNIAKDVKGAKLSTSHKKDYLTPSQAKALLTSIDRTTTQGKRDYAIISLMLTTGLRTIEVATANLEDLRTVADFTALYIQGKGHDDKDDYIKVSEPVEDAIRDYLKARGKADATAPLFTSQANRNSQERLTTRSISRIVKTHLVNIGLDSDRLTAHSLRHTAGTIALKNGATLVEVQQLLRHTNINTTLIYVHAIKREENTSEDRVSNVIFN